MFNWTLDAANTIRFVMVDDEGSEVEGLDDGFTLELMKPGAAVFSAGAGTKSEIGSGWYEYAATEAEGDTLGFVAIKVTGDGCVQQNLLAQVGDPLDVVVEGTYTARQLLRLMAAVLMGESSGGGTTTNRFRDLLDTKNRISATVDESGNRTAVVLDAE